MKTPERYTILELGFAGYPAIGVPERRPLERDQQYIGLGPFDGPNPEHEAAVAQVMLDVYNKIFEGHRQVRIGLAQDLSFLNHQVNEIIAVDLLGYPILSQPTRQTIASEARRVIAATGLVTVVETMTPHIHPIDTLAELMGAHGFQQTNSGQERNPEQIALYSDVKNTLGYIATFAPNQR
ncbi:MAG TPA: hypothetical protein VFB59_01835 [Candidatus Saccharimonadales bacterium]|nr:hypothetical protein [Candidatus Saccharimonadales bacterium]